MASHLVNGVRYYYEERGSGDQVIFFGHGLMYHWRIFEPQMEYFAAKGFRCIAIDWRGQGQTEGGGTLDDYSMYRLGADAYQLLSDLGITRVHWVGVSMGGMIGLRLYPKHPELFLSFTLIDSSAGDAPELLDGYRQMGDAYLAYGLIPPLREGLDAVFYTPKMTERHPQVLAYWHAYWTNADRESLYKAIIPVIDRDDVTNTISQIAVPTLILVGVEDMSTPPAKSEAMQQLIANAQLRYIDDASHMSILEQPEAITAAMAEFIG